MGAQGVCIGRPYIWGLGAFGQPGVERVLELLRAELRVAMQQVGAPTIKHLVPAMGVALKPSRSARTSRNAPATSVTIFEIAASGSKLTRRTASFPRCARARRGPR